MQPPLWKGAITIAKKFYNGIDGQSQKAVNFADPTSATDLGTKQYIDNLVNGLSWKNEVKAVTSTVLPTVTYANGTAGVGATLTATANAAFAALDGETPTLNDRYLIKDQAAPLQNGIYSLSTVGTGATPFVLTRVTDLDTTAEANNASVYVTEGTVRGGTAWTQTTKNPVIGTNNLVFSQIPSTAYTASLGVTLSGSDFRLAAGVSGAGLTLTSGVLDIVAADTSLTVNADSVQVNPAASGGLTVSSGLKVDSTVARIFRQATNANSTSVAVTHNLGTATVVARVFITSTGEEIECDVTATSTTVTTFVFGSAPALNTLSFVIVG